MQGPLSVVFPIDNRGSPVGMSELRSHLNRTKHMMTFAKPISDFHLLLKLATFLDVKADVPCASPSCMCISIFQFLCDYHSDRVTSFVVVAMLEPYLAVT